jgi:signal peptidase I
MGKSQKWVAELILILALVLFIRAFFVQAFNIPSASMQPTLLIGDFILVNKLLYRFSEPRRGDIVVFKYPQNEALDYIKRIVGMPGDRIEFKETVEEGLRVYELRVNGKPIDMRYIGRQSFNGREYAVFEEYIPSGDGSEIAHKVWFRTSGFTMPGMCKYDCRSGFLNYDIPIIPEGYCLKSESGICTEFIVPESSYFVMGDNRDNSEDSRFWGFVPRSNIVGKAFVIYFSGKVPSLTPDDVSVFTGFRQLFYALINPRPSRIGKPLIW